MYVQLDTPGATFGVTNDKGVTVDVQQMHGAIKNNAEAVASGSEVIDRLMAANVSLAGRWVAAIGPIFVEDFMNFRDWCNCCNLA